MPKVMAKVVAKLRKFFLPYAQSKIADRHIKKDKHCSSMKYLKVLPARLDQLENDTNG
jgi:hypothetical protein